MRKVWVGALAGALQLASPAAATKPGSGPGVMLAGATLLRSSQTVVPVRISRTAATLTGGHAEVVVEGLTYDAPPGVLYEVSLKGPEERRVPIGLISFYNRSAPGYGVAAAAGTDGRRVFDASEALRALGGQVTALVFEPTAGVSGPGVRVTASAGARVRFASVWLK